MHLREELAIIRQKILGATLQYLVSLAARFLDLCTPGFYYL